MTKAYKFVAAISVVLAAFGCAKSHGKAAAEPVSQKAKAAPAPEQVPAPAPAKPATTPSAEPNLANLKPDEVMAKYDGQTLTLQQIRYIIPAATPESARQLAQQWVDLQMMYEAARERGITNDPKAKLLAQLNSESLFVRELMTKIAEEVNVPDANVREYYDKYKDTDPQLSEPNRLSFAHVRTKTIEEANAVKKRIEAGEDIAVIAKELSITPDAKNGGAVKKMPQMSVARQYGREFANAMTAAAEGEIIGPIKVRDGFEVARNEGKLASKVYPFDKVRKTIKSNLEQTAKAQATEKFKEELKKQSQSKIYFSPVLETPAPKMQEQKSAKDPNLPVDKTSSKTDNPVQKK
jgi:peptidyl-prolyl cis-trans isomerase C